MELDLSNNRIDRLAQVVAALEQHHPRNEKGPICIVAPRRVHRQWKYAWRQYQLWRTAQKRPTQRYMLYCTPEQFAEHCVQSIEPAPLTLFEQADWVFIVDDMFPEQRDPVRAAVKKLNPDQGHRMFMTTVAPEKNHVLTNIAA